MNQHNMHQRHFARKRFGQNFLNDQSIIDNIVAAINPGIGQSIVEIGPGLAALTLPVAERIERMTVIEIDRDLVRRLSIHPQLAKKLIIIEKDVMKVDFSQLAEQEKQCLRIFGNLPYNISTPLLFHLFDYAGCIDDMYFMLQKEVVNRLVAVPNNKNYGKLTVMAQYYCEIIPVIDVPAWAFTPQPKVESTVTRLIPHKQPKYFVASVQLLYQITSYAFNQRRKTLHNSLNVLFNDSQLIEAGVDPTLRAENLSVGQYCELANYLFKQST